MRGIELWAEASVLVTNSTDTEGEKRMQRCIRNMMAEIRRLNGAITVEQNLTDRIGTHGPACYEWGPKHYECAKIRINELEEELKELMEKQGGKKSAV